MFNLNVFNLFFSRLAFLRISSLKYWLMKPYTNNVISKGLLSLKSVALNYMNIIDENLQTQSSEVIDEPSPNCSFSSCDLFKEYYDDDVPESGDFQLESREFRFKSKLEDELNDFSILLCDKNFLNKKQSTKEFCQSNSRKFPILYKVPIILLNINSSSAFIERFFSIAGVITNKRRSNMKDDLLVTRSILKSNIQILEEMNLKENEKKL